MAAGRATPAAIACAVLLLTAPACRGGGASGGKGGSTVPFVAVDPASASPTDRAIATAQQRLRVNADDSQARLDLANAFLQKVREVADPSLYVKARGLLDPLEKKQPSNV